jgi:hypothetical protein
MLIMAEASSPKKCQGLSPPRSASQLSAPPGATNQSHPLSIIPAPALTSFIYETGASFPRIVKVGEGVASL